MRIWARTLIVCVLAGAILGCLEFDEQTVYVEHDEANDRLILIVNYMGLFAGKSNSHSALPGPADMDQSENQLENGLAQHAVALVDTWPLAFSAQQVRDGLAKPDSKLSADLRGRIEGLLDGILVRNGGFYTDPAGRLCAAQVVIVEHVSTTIPLLNGIINSLLLEDPDRKVDPGWQNARELARNGHEWIKLSGHALEVCAPLAEKELAAGRREFVADVLEEYEELVGTSLCDLLANPVFVWHEDELLRLRIGYRSMPCELIALPALGDYRPNLEEHVAQTYGLHLDANLAHYLLEPDAPAQTEEQEAARMMVPRLTQRQRVRVLIHILGTKPSDAFRAKLRAEPLPRRAAQNPNLLPEAELLAWWQGWLASRPVPRAKD